VLHLFLTDRMSSILHAGRCAKRKWEKEEHPSSHYAAARGGDSVKKVLVCSPDQVRGPCSLKWGRKRRWSILVREEEHTPKTGSAGKGVKLVQRRREYSSGGRELYYQTPNDKEGGNGRLHVFLLTRPKRGGERGERIDLTESGQSKAAVRTGRMEEKGLYTLR